MKVQLTMNPLEEKQARVSSTLTPSPHDQLIKSMDDKEKENRNTINIIECITINTYPNR